MVSQDVLSAIAMIKYYIDLIEDHLKTISDRGGETDTEDEYLFELNCIEDMISDARYKLEESEIRLLQYCHMKENDECVSPTDMDAASDEIAGD